MEKPTIPQLVEALTNTCDSTTCEQFLQEMRKVHPALQQSFAGFVIAWIVDYSQNYSVDSRNKSSISECWKLLESYRIIHQSDPKTTFRF